VRGADKEHYQKRSKELRKTKKSTEKSLKVHANKRNNLPTLKPIFRIVAEKSRAISIGLMGKREKPHFRKDLNNWYLKKEDTLSGPNPGTVRKGAQRTSAQTKKGKLTRKSCKKNKNHGKKRRGLSTRKPEETITGKELESRRSHIPTAKKYICLGISSVGGTE